MKLMVFEICFGIARYFCRRDAILWWEQVLHGNDGEVIRLLKMNEYL